jgi:hypothetical protein
MSRSARSVPSARSFRSDSFSRSRMRPNRHSVLGFADRNIEHGRLMAHRSAR